MTDNKLSYEIDVDDRKESHIENDGTYKYFLNNFEEYEDGSLQDTNPKTLIKILRSDLSAAEKHELEMLSHRRTLRGLPNIERKSKTDALVMVPNTDDVIETIIARALIGISSFDENKVVILLKKEQDWIVAGRIFRHCLSLFMEEEDVYKVDDREGHPFDNKDTKKWCIKLDCGEEKQIVFTKDFSSLDEGEYNLLLVQDASTISDEDFLGIIKRVSSLTTSQILFSSFFAESSTKIGNYLSVYLLKENISFFGDSLFLWR